MPLFFRRGTMKPPLGARVNPEHPFAQGAVALVPMLESLGIPANYGSAATTLSKVGAPVWASNPQGAAYQFPTTSSCLRFNSTDNIPTAAATICIIRRKLDTTLRTAGLFGFQGGTTTSKKCGAAVPNSSGNVVFDFGGATGANRLTVTGLSFTTDVERWVFTAGPAGSAIWRDGIKVGSQSTAITRTSGGGAFNIGYGIESGSTSTDLQDVNFFQVNNVQWVDGLCQWWSAEPYAHLYATSASRRFFVLGDTAWHLAPGQKALMYALGNVARGGATRGQYHDARVYIAIDGTHYATARTDDTPRILDVSLTITDVVDNTPNTCRFVTKGFIPTEGQDIIITLGSKNNGKRLFGGQILRVGQSYTGTPANFVASVDAIDYSWRLNRR